MLSAARFAGVLAAVVLVELLLGGFLPAVADLVDLYVLLVVLNSLRGNSFRGLAGGLAAGLVQDMFTSSIYGLHSLACCVVGYGGARVSQRILTSQRVVSGLLIAAGVLVHQAIVIGLLATLEIAQFNPRGGRGAVACSRDHNDRPGRSLGGRPGARVDGEADEPAYTGTGTSPIALAEGCSEGEPGNSWPRAQRGPRAAHHGDPPEVARRIACGGVLRRSEFLLVLPDRSLGALLAVGREQQAAGRPPGGAAGPDLRPFRSNPGRECAHFPSPDRPQPECRSGCQCGVCGEHRGTGTRKN